MTAALPDLMRRLDRKLDIQRGLHLSYDDLALLVASGAYATLRRAAEDEERSRLLPAIELGEAGRDPFIYLIQAGDCGPIKIGFAKDVQKRRDALQISVHEHLAVRASWCAPQRCEKALHCHFRPEHVRGEWYRPSPRLLAFIDEAAALQ